MTLVALLAHLSLGPSFALSGPATSEPFADTLAPDREQARFGKLEGGSLESWAADDQDARLVCKLFTVALPHPFAEIELRYDPPWPNKVKAVQCRVKVASHSSGRQDLGIEIKRRDGLFEYTTLKDDQIVAGTTYVAYPLGPAKDYVQVDGTISIKVESWQRGPTAHLFPCVSFEFANVVVSY